MLTKFSFKRKLILLLLLIIFFMIGSLVTSMNVLNKWNTSINNLSTDRFLFLELSKSVSSFSKYFQDVTYPVLTQKQLKTIDELKIIQEKNKRLLLVALSKSRASVSQIDQYQPSDSISNPQYNLFREIYNLQRQLSRELFLIDLNFNLLITNQASLINKDDLQNTYQFSQNINAIDNYLWKINESISKTIQGNEFRIQLLIIILVVFSFIISGFLLIGFYKNIFKRLTAITNIADSIRLNEPLPKINIDLSDEITNIAKTLYRLDHDITKKEHIIKNRERSLEDKSSRLSKLNNQLINVIESERQDIAQFIHNDIGQHLTAIKFELDWLTNNNVTKSNIVSCQQLVNDCMLQIKKVSRAIHTPFIKELGLKKPFYNY